MRGMYQEPITTLDFALLYPSIIQVCVCGRVCVYIYSLYVCIAWTSLRCTPLSFRYVYVCIIAYACVCVCVCTQTHIYPQEGHVPRAYCCTGLRFAVPLYHSGMCMRACVCVHI